MVSNILGLTRSGLRDWFVQRVTAVILALYTIFLVVFAIIHQPHLSFSTWHTLFQSFWMKLATLLAVLSLAMHAWVGIWTILTDYVKPAKLRGLIQFLVILALFGYVIWAIQILWS